MLNELYQLSLTLERAGIIPRDWHKDLKPLPNVTPKKPCYRILIAQDGSISGIETIGKELALCLRKWEPSNGNSFPGFNIQPLYRVSDETNKKILKKWREGKEPIDLQKLKELCADDQAKNWDSKFDKKLNKCLWVIPNGLLERCADIQIDFEPVKKLCERLIQWGTDSSEKFFQALESSILAFLEKNENSRNLISILFHEGSLTKAPDQDRGSISVFMDVPDWKDFPVAHEKTVECINEHFVKSSNTVGGNAKNGIDDAFGGLIDGFEEKLPEVKLPVIGGVKLRAMNKESPCQYRYGTIDAKSFLIGFESRRRAKGALEWLGGDLREGQTWGRADGRELLFAYPAFLPKVLPQLASCFGAKKSDDSEARFAKYAEDVVDCLKGLAPSLKDIDLRVFSLRKMDKARTKIVFHRNYSAQRLADAAGEWRKGCENIPEIKIDAWGKKKGEIIHVDLEMPFPLEISDCLNRVWKLDGTTQSEVKIVHKSDGIELLLDETANQRLVPHLLSIAIQNSKGLFCSMGQSINRNEILKLDGFNKHKQLMPPIIGLLLWKIGIDKEMYMKNAPFLIGRIFKLADEIHALYCKEVRGNNLPPQLVGNSLMTAAIESPIQAISQLALRLKPYYGWAQTFRRNEDGGLAGYYIYLYGQTASQLAEYEIPARFNDAERAQVLLGYLAANTQKV